MDSIRRLAGFEMKGAAADSRSRYRTHLKFFSYLTPTRSAKEEAELDRRQVNEKDAVHCMRVGACGIEARRLKADFERENAEALRRGDGCHERGSDAAAR
ncbi:hypothetical protein [Caballeronia hypogeia]|uniref:hypothetical protein n=1 Tax=Caballeronia hypogeia TaxID=1777140 RepID=UPI0012FE259E|nr:hypothetical protein [Caballeronia hypogeia]